MNNRAKTHVNGAHHITAIAGAAQENVDFYAGVLGMRLVKRTVNQDAPETYHLFYADAEGAPGTDLTFFAWPEMPPARLGHGLATEVSLEIPAGALPYWGSRLEGYRVPLGRVESRFGSKALPLVDPHGLKLALVEAVPDSRRRSTPWHHSPVDASQQIRGLHGARIWEADVVTTGAFLVNVLGFRRIGAEGGFTRYGFDDAPGVVDVRERPGDRRGSWGVGCVHHLAWRVEDGEHQLAMRARVEAAGARATRVIDRFWFKSVYFLEPGGVLFEIATDGPGFAIDENPDRLGERLVVPPFLEQRRAEIERGLPPLALPAEPPGRGQRPA